MTAERPDTFAPIRGVALAMTREITNQTIVRLPEGAAEHPADLADHGGCLGVVASAVADGGRLQHGVLLVGGGGDAALVRRGPTPPIHGRGSLHVDG